MRKPNPSNVTDALLNALLPGNANSQPTDQTSFHDVILQSSDNHKIPALKPLLALRSPFFSRLFYGPFSESASATIAIDLPQKSLTQVLHFIYADESPSLRRLDDAIRRSYGGSKLRRKAWAALRCHDIEAAVGIVAAADYCQINALAQWGCSLIMKAIRVKQGLACVALQAIVQRGGVCSKLAQVQESLLKYIVRYTPGCFAAPYGDEGRPLAVRECFGYAGKCGIMHLGENAISLVFENLKTEDSEFLSMAVTFEALYFWGSGGKNLLEAKAEKEGSMHAAKDSEPNGKDEESSSGPETAKEAEPNRKESSGMKAADDSNSANARLSAAQSTLQTGDTYKQSARWKIAMTCAAMMQAPTTIFLVTVLEPSGLLSQDVLFKFYRDVARNAVTAADVECCSNGECKDEDDDDTACSACVRL